MKLTESQMIAELAKLLVVPTDDDGHQTSEEIMEATGWSIKKVQRAIRAAKKAGRLSRRRVMRDSVQDFLVPVSAYKLLEEPNVQYGS